MKIVSKTKETIEKYKQEFSANGIVRINDFIEEGDINTLSAFVKEGVQYHNAFFINNENKEATDEEIAKLQPEERRSLYMNIYQNASQGVGFLYGRHKVSDNSPALLVDTLKSLNETETREFIKAICGTHSLTHVDGQVTRYRVGDFLTRHNDDVPGETREIAYVLGLSPQWHPDWGGLLQLYSNDGTPQKSWSPQYNSLTIFDVKKVHSVTSITPFSPQSRYSITGWFRR